MTGEPGGFDGGVEKGGPGGVVTALTENGSGSISPETIEAEREADPIAADEPGETVDTAELMARLRQAETDLAAALEQLAAAERRARIDAALVGEGPVDLETARTMAEAVIGEQDIEDVPAAIGALRERKPFLFARAEPAGIRSAAMAAEPARDAGTELDEIAEQARASGDRRELLRYLRTRRGS